MASALVLGGDAWNACVCFFVYFRVGGSALRTCNHKGTKAKGTAAPAPICHVCCVHARVRALVFQCVCVCVCVRVCIVCVCVCRAREPSKKIQTRVAANTASLDAAAEQPHHKPLVRDLEIQMTVVYERLL